MNTLKNLDYSQLDFASGQKTIVGIALFMLPMLATRLGYEITPESASMVVSQWVQIIGAVLSLYGMAAKAVKTSQASFTKKK